MQYLEKLTKISFASACFYVQLRVSRYVTLPRIRKRIKVLAYKIK